MSDANFKTCPRCAEEVRAAALVCRFCGHEFQAPNGSEAQAGAPASRTTSQLQQPPPSPRPSHSNLWIIWVGAGVLVVAILAFMFSHSSSTDNSAAPNQTATASPPADAGPQIVSPPEETKFIAAVQSALSAFNAAPNDMAKGAARSQRRAAVCEAIPNLIAKNWIGTIKTLDSNGDGKGVLAITLANGVTVATWNNALSDSGDGTLMDQSSDVFKAASAMKVGDQTEFSGNFFPSDVDCAKERSITLDGSIQDPEYIFRFASVSPPIAASPAEQKPANSPDASPNLNSPLSSLSLPPAQTNGFPPPATGPADANAQGPTPPDPASTQDATAAAPPVSVRPSFDCNAALNQAERAICANSTLAALDAQVGDMYRQARERAADPREIILDQRQWMGERNACTNDACLASVYSRRKAELARWVGDQ